MGLRFKETCLGRRVRDKWVLYTIRQPTQESLLEGVYLKEKTTSDTVIPPGTDALGGEAVEGPGLLFLPVEAVTETEWSVLETLIGEGRSQTDTTRTRLARSP